MIKKVTTNSFIQIIGRLIGLFLSLVTLRVVANNLEINESTVIGFGYFALVFVYASTISMVIDLGVFPFLVKKISSADNEQTKEEAINQALGLRLMLLIPLTIITIILLNFLPYPGFVLLSILFGVFSSFIGLLSQVLASYFQAHFLAFRIIFSEIIGRCTILFLAYNFIDQGAGLTTVMVFSIAGSVVTLFLSILLSRRYYRIRPRFSFKYWQAALPSLLMIALLSWIFYFQIRLDSIVYSWFGQDAELGEYLASFKLMEVIQVIPSIVAANIFVVASLNASPQKKVSFPIKKFIPPILAFSVISIVIIQIFAPLIIRLVYNEQFNDTVELLRIQSLSLIPLFLISAWFQTMLAYGRNRYLLAVVGTFSVIQLISYYYVASLRDPVTMAWATVIFSWSLLLFAFLTYKRADEYRETNQSY